MPATASVAVPAAASTAASTAARGAPLDMSPDEFRAVGHALVDRLAEFYASLRHRPVTTGAAPREVRRAIGDGPLPEHGTAAATLLDDAAELLCEGSLHNGHPRFWGYITSSAAPIGALGDLLSAAVNPNVGSFTLSPVATEIERQAVRWLCELMGVPTTWGGLFVSGGNMANFVGVLAARRARAPAAVRERGLSGVPARLTIHASRDAHTWVHKAADLFGFGLDAVRWIATDARGRMDVGALDAALHADRDAGTEPLLVVATAGTVGTGALDPLPEIAALCRERGPWLHVDGAYGALAAALPRDRRPAALEALGEADSLAVDPHKWLYAPLEAGCALVRDPRHLLDAFSHHPTYYEFGGAADDPPVNFHELGPQNSRGFRALKVWLGLRQAGRVGVARSIADDCALARALHEAAATHPALEARTQSLSITTFRYVPPDLPRGAAGASDYLDALNRAIVERLQAGGEAFVSNAVVDGDYLLRACIVNFRTTAADVEALPALVARLGAEVDAAIRPATLK